MLKKPSFKPLKSLSTGSCYFWSLFFITAFSIQTQANNLAWFVPSHSDLPFSQPVTELSDEQLDQFILGRSFFSIPWVEAPSATTARDGLGPLFNANTCASCHEQHNSARVFNSDGSVHRSLVFKLAKPSKHQTSKLSPPQGDTRYGSQININGTANVPFEAKVQIKQHKQTIKLADQTPITLTHYEPVLNELNYGPLDEDTRISLRQASAIVGVGLIEQIKDDAILALQKEQAARKDGIAGKANWVINPLTKQKTLGRFGHKASQSSVMMQVADAAAHDMGLTNAFFPNELCSQKQTACLKAPKGRPSPQGILDLPTSRLAAMSFYVSKHKAPAHPALNKQQTKGRAVFTQLGCQRCHHASFKLDHGITISPYSDFLLHDLGEALADNRPEFMASSRQWRTAPLWGLGHRVRTQRFFLHDGRASTLTQAILWHSGEAQGAQQQFKQLSTTNRNHLLQFLEAL